MAAHVSSACIPSQKLRMLWEGHLLAHLHNSTSFFGNSRKKIITVEFYPCYKIKQRDATYCLFSPAGSLQTHRMAACNCTPWMCSTLICRWNVYPTIKCRFARQNLALSCTEPRNRPTLKTVGTTCGSACMFRVKPLRLWSYTMCQKLDHFLVIQF